MLSQECDVSLLVSPVEYEASARRREEYEVPGLAECQEAPGLAECQEAPAGVSAELLGNTPEE